MTVLGIAVVVVWALVLGMSPGLALIAVAGLLALEIAAPRFPRRVGEMESDR
jgi:hypothetical protein